MGVVAPGDDCGEAGGRLDELLELEDRWWGKGGGLEPVGDERVAAGGGEGVAAAAGEPFLLRKLPLGGVLLPEFPLLVR
jgi:hypothetical protein